MRENGTSVKFEDHIGLIHKLTKKCWGRLMDLDINEEYEDVFQLNCITYVKVSQMYDPSRGITFGAYLGRAIYNEFNKYADKVISEKVELHLQNYDDFMEDGDDFMSTFIHDTANINPVENAVVGKRIARENIANLSQLGKLVIRELLSPSGEVIKSNNARKVHAELAKKVGEKYTRPSKEIDIRAIALHYGIKDKKVRALMQEFERKLGVKLGK